MRTTLGGAVLVSTEIQTNLILCIWYVYVYI